MRQLMISEFRCVAGGADNVAPPSDFGQIVIFTPPSTFPETTREDNTYEDWQKKQQAKLI